VVLNSLGTPSTTGPAAQISCGGRYGGIRICMGKRVSLGGGEERPLLRRHFVHENFKCPNLGSNPDHSCWKPAPEVRCFTLTNPMNLIVWVLHPVASVTMTFCSEGGVIKKLHGLSPRANYTDRETAACRRSDCQLVRLEGSTWSA
jgi:hypothetical protein